MFQISSRRETCNQVPESSRSEFLEANNFALSDAEDNTSWPLNRGGIADLLLLKKLVLLLTFYQNSPEPSFKNTSVRTNKYLQKSWTVKIKVWNLSR